MEAIAAAVAAQRGLAAAPWPDEGQIRVRMGIHVGEVELRDGDYSGVEVHRAARIAATGHGGQLLLSAAAAAVIGDRLPDGLSLHDLGEYELKDFDKPIRIHQVTGEGLAAAAIGARAARRTNLAERRSSFIGREAELAGVAEALSANRLVTLTGPGGTGKTSLAVEAGRRQAADYPGGAWLVELAPLSDVDFVITTVNHAVGLADDPTRPALETLIDHLAGQRTLLILDNLEQLLRRRRAHRPVAGRRRSLHPGHQSRALRVAGEREFPVPPLVGPGRDRRHGRRLADAVQLFVERARRLTRFALTDANRAAVAEICRRLDGLPLAIELAAARVKLLSPAEILDRFRAGQARWPARPAVPERQQTLRGPSAGAIGSCQKPSRHSSRGSRSSPADARSRPRSPSATPTQSWALTRWTRWRRWSTRAC